MNIEHMGYIIEIAEKGSISKAAQELFVPQPYLSNLVKKIEKDLNISIFNRSNQGITLTKEGIEFVKKAKVILNQYKGLRNIEVDRKEIQNKFSITTVRSSLVMESFIDLLKKYNDKQELEFTIKETNSNTPIQDVAYSDVDVGVIYTIEATKQSLIEELNLRNLEYETICLFQPCIIVGVNHPILKTKKEIELADLNEYGVVLYQEDQLPYTDQSSTGESANPFINLEHVKKKVYVSNRASFHNILTHTDYYSVGTQAAKNQEKMFNITSIPFKRKSSDPKLEMGVFYRKDSSIHPIARQLIDTLKKNYSQSLLEN